MMVATAAPVSSSEPVGSVLDGVPPEMVEVLLLLDAAAEALGEPPVVRERVGSVSGIRKVDRI